MKKYSKISKLLMIVLILVSAVLLVWGFAAGWEKNEWLPVDVLLDWAYIMVVLTLAAVVFVGIGINVVNEPKSLVKMGIGLAAIAVVCLIAYILAPGAPAVGLITEQPSASTLKLTDTVLYLTYFSGILAILAIVVGEIRLSITNKKG